MARHYYKFRSLQNLKRFIDIVLNERLYASAHEGICVGKWSSAS